MEESVSFTLRFPSGVIASCLTSYGPYNSKSMRLHLEGGTVELPDIFAYRGQRMLVLRKQDGVATRAERKIAHRNQFALEMDHFSRCILDDRVPHTPGEEGLQDQVLTAAIYRAAEERRVVEVPRPAGATRGPEPDRAG